MPEDDPGSHNAFDSAFLDRVDQVGEPDGAHEADVAGPWTVHPVSYQGGRGFAVLRQWESLEAGDRPYAIFLRRETALLAAAILPVTGREPLFRLATEPDQTGFPLHAATAPTPTNPQEPSIGHLRDFDQDLAAALHLVAALVRSPQALANLLEAAGHVALHHAGRLLDRRFP